MEKIIKEQNAAGLMDARFCPCGFDAHPILCAVLRDGSLLSPKNAAIIGIVDKQIPIG